MQRPKTYFYFRNYKYRNLVNLQAYLFIYLVETSLFIRL